MLQLRVRAPFAAFRTFTAGYYRPTAPFLPPSVAYGLLLNLAAIESRRDDGVSRMTLTAAGLPAARIALGAIRLPEVQTLYQQLHNYPVGTSGQERRDAARGNKYNIQPIRRELLADLDAYICLDGNDELEGRVRAGLAAGADYAPEGRHRYGLPFLGDNSFSISSLTIETEPLPAHWLTNIEREHLARAEEVYRLTVWIDRADLTRTDTRYYSPARLPQVAVPATAWTSVEPPP